MVYVVVHLNVAEFRGLDTGYFTLRQIKAATDDFNHRNKIGEGGFGPVFKVSRLNLSKNKVGPDSLIVE